MNPAEFDNIAASERDFWWFRGMREILFRILDPVVEQDAETAEASVLEAGCGTGYLSKVLSQRYGWRMTPLDLGWRGLEYAHHQGIPHLVQGDITQLPFQKESFDGLVSMDVVVHLPQGEERRAFREFARVLRPSGLLVVRVSALKMLRSRHSEFAHERQRFTRTRLVDAVESEGFQVMRATYANSLLMPVAWFKFRVWEPLTGAKPASGVQPVAKWLDTLLYQALRCEAGWYRMGGGFPIGQSLVLVARKAD